MNTIQFLAEWAVRSSLLIGVATAALWALRVKDSSIRLAAWTAVLMGSLLIPVMSASLPTVPVHVTHAAQAIAPIPIEPAAQSITPIVNPQASRSQPFDWMAAAFIFYAAIALAMLLRLAIGLLGSLRLLRRSNVTERENIRESERIAAPVTLGILRPSIVLPPDWREWDRAKLDAVLAHERSHIERRDPLVQLGSAIHRALLWISPLTWFLHSRIVRAAEEASDDAAVVAIQDRAFYAELLLDFVQRGVRVRTTPVAGVPMARYGRADERIHRILDSTALSRGVSKRAIAAIMLIGVPLAYIVATAKAQSPAPPASPMQTPKATFQPRATAPKPLQTKLASTSGDLEGLGTVIADTVTVRAPTEGRLGVNFREGHPIELGQTLGVVGADKSSENSALVGLKVDLAKARVKDLQGTRQFKSSGAREECYMDTLHQMQEALSSNPPEIRRQIKRQMKLPPTSGHP